MRRLKVAIIPPSRRFPEHLFLRRGRTSLFLPYHKYALTCCTWRSMYQLTSHVKNKHDYYFDIVFCFLYQRVYNSIRRFNTSKQLCIYLCVPWNNFLRKKKRVTGKENSGLNTKYQLNVTMNTRRVLVWVQLVTYMFFE